MGASAGTMGAASIMQVGDGLQFSNNTVMAGSLLVCGSMQVGGLDVPEMGHRLEKLELQLASLSEALAGLKEMVMQCYIAPGMPGAPCDFSSH